MPQCEETLSEMAIRLYALVGINFKTPAFPSSGYENPELTRVLDRGPARACGTDV